MRFSIIGLNLLVALRGNTSRAQNALMAKGVLMLALTLSSPVALAETACVKYGPCPLDLKPFDCTETPRSSFVRKVCYDAPKKFMVIKLQETWYPYCAIDAGTVQSLLTASSAGSYYNQNIRSKPGGAHGPFDCRDHPIPNYP